MSATTIIPKTMDGGVADGPSAAEIARRDAARFAEQVALLYKTTLAIPGNLACTIIVAIAIGDSYPTGWLLAWVGATAAVVLLRLELSRRYRRAARTDADAPRWGRLFFLGTLSSGVLWGAISLGLPIFGTEHDFLFLAIVGAGTTAASLNWLAVYPELRSSPSPSRWRQHLSSRSRANTSRSAA